MLKEILVVTLTLLILWVGFMALIAIPATWLWNSFMPLHLNYLQIWLATLVLSAIFGGFRFELKG